MLAHLPTQSSGYATPMPVEGAVQPQELNPYQHRALPPAMRLPDKGSLTDDKNERKDREKKYLKEAEELARKIPGMFQLLISPDFTEFVHHFFVNGHRDLLAIRTCIRRQKGITEFLLFRTETKQNHHMDGVRTETYQIPFRFLRTPAGFHFNALV